MAASGSFQRSLVNGHYVWKVEWSITQSVSNNATTPTANIYLINDYAISVKATSGHSLTINGVKYAFSSPAISTKGTHLIATIKGNPITHNADGTKSVNMSLNYKVDANLSGTYYGTITASGTAVFNTIARATAPTLGASSAYIGDNVTITLNRASSNFTHNLQAKFGSGSLQQTKAIGTNIASSVTWKIPDAFLNAVPNSTSGTCTIECYTYNNGTYIGMKTVTLTLKVKDDVKPTVAFTVTEANNAVSGKGFTDFIQSLSKLLIKSTAAEAGGSTIKAYSVTAAGTTYSGSTVTTNTLAVSGDITVTVKVTDSRGRTGTASKPINVKAYARPKISAYSVRRCNADGTSNDAGEYCKVTVSASAANIAGNILTVDLDAIESGQSSGTSFTLSNTGISYSGSKVVPNINPNKSYSFKLTAKDAFYPTPKTIPISSAVTIIHIKSNEKGVGIGKVCESDAFEIGYETKFYKNVSVRKSNGEFTALPKIAAGTISITPTAANTPTAVSILFPAGLFTAAPTVTVTPHSSAPGTAVLGVGVNNRTAEGCDIILTRTNTVATTVSWQAIQP